MFTIPAFSLLGELTTVIGSNAGALGSILGGMAGGGGGKDPNAAFNSLIYSATQSAKYPGTITPPDVPGKSVLGSLFQQDTSRWASVPERAKQDMIKSYGSLDAVKKAVPNLFTQAQVSTYDPSKTGLPYSGYSQYDAQYISESDKNKQMTDFFIKKLNDAGHSGTVEDFTKGLIMTWDASVPNEVQQAKKNKFNLETVYSKYINLVKYPSGYTAEQYKTPEQMYNDLMKEANDLINQQAQSELDLALQQQKDAITLEQKNLDTIMLNQRSRTLKKQNYNNSTILGALS